MKRVARSFAAGDHRLLVAAAAILLPVRPE